MRSPRLLYLVTDDRYFLSHRLELARAAREAGYEVTVASRDTGLADRIRGHGFAFEPLPFERRARPLALLRLLVSTVRLYRRLRPDLVHHVSMRPILLGGMASRLAGHPPGVDLVTGLGYVFISGPWLLRRCVEAAYRWTFRRRGSLPVFQNPDDRDLFVERGLVRAEASRIIPGSGVDPEVFQPKSAPCGPPRVLFASRMLWDKGAGELVEAARILRARGLDFELWFAGRVDPANPAAVPEQDLRRWEAEGLLRWLGHVEDIPSLLGRCHIACLPSYREGVPRALLEAASAGLPVVTTDVPGCREVVTPGVSGLLVPPRDPEALAEALAGLLMNPEQRRAMGTAGRALVEERFSSARILEQTLRVYRKALEQASDTSVQLPPESIRPRFSGNE